MELCVEESSLAGIKGSDRHQQDQIDHQFSLLKKNVTQSWWLKVLLVLLYFPAIVLLVLSYLQWSDARNPSPRQQDIYPDMILTPAMRSNAIKHEIRRFPQDYHNSVYAGDPSPELDLAWHYLFEDNNIRVEKHDLDNLALDSIPLANGGYVAQLGVFHELHCLKKVRHWIFKDYYITPKNPSKSDWAEWPAHINHCLEMLRVAIMCRGDTSLSTFKWIGKSDNRLPTAWDHSPHQCVNWEILSRWTREQSVNISAPGTLLDEHGRLFP